MTLLNYLTDGTLLSSAFLLVLPSTNVRLNNSAAFLLKLEL